MENQEYIENSQEMKEKKELIKKKIKDFFSKPLNKYLFFVILFGAGIRLYYFFTIGNQPLWWDEACYGSLAKNLISGQWSNSSLILGESIIRPPLFPILWSLLLRMSFSEMAIRFFLEIIPSIFSIFFVYLIGKEAFNKRIGIISAFIFSVLWIHVFYSIRLLTNIPAMFFLFASFYYFIKSTKKELNYNHYLLALFLLSLSTLMRYPNGIIFFVYFIILFGTKKLHLTKFKFWIYSFIGIAPLLLFFTYNHVSYGNIFPAFLGDDYIDRTENIQKPIAWNLLSFIKVFLQNTFFIFFLIGFFTALFYLFLGYNQIFKNKKFKNYFLLLLFLISIYSFFIFYMRAAEDRWLFPILMPLAIFSAYGIDFSYKYFKKYNKIFGVFFLIAVLGFGAYNQLNFAEDLIDNKKTSYLQIRQGFEWIKQNTPKNSTIIGSGIEPYSIYYAERDYIPIYENGSNFEKLSQANYLIGHSFSPQSKFLIDYLQENQNSISVEKIFFFDLNKQEPALIIYKNNN